ncbi:cell wall biosynthesis protein [Roseivirga misakiensis]|uniref:N-acetylmuramoyl-L-alanine amidase n=1 Tax=Roseivirga misakiensis TaxID=1563681 RepID=A0A1E5T2N0_9BACT|nr:cell wall biosynthesis protein [Roseivirga misakiensis]
MVFLFIIFQSLWILNSNAQSTPKTVIAVSGDGIHKILIKHGFDPIKYYNEFIRLNKKNISRSNGLFIGKKYTLPTKAKNDSPAKPNSINYPLFGKKYENVPIVSTDLKGAIYYLISGHGGPDPGAVAKRSGKTLAEDEYAYDVTLRLARGLLARGAQVYLIIKDANDGIRDESILKVDYDEVNYPDQKIPRNQKLRLRQRTLSVNKLFGQNGKAYQRLIVTHVDSRGQKENVDVFFYHHKNSKKGKKLADELQSTFKKKYEQYQPNRKYTGTVSNRSNLYVIRNTLPPMVYIELGNLKNTKDQRRILNSENREALANWITEGLLADYKKAN